MPFPGTGRKINGKVYDYSSITIVVNNTPYQGITEINYSDNLEPGELRGTSAYVRGLSRGQYSAEGGFTIAKGDYEPIKEALAGLGLGGFMEASFLISVTYQEVGSLLITDTIEGCRIKKNDNSHSSGNAEPLMHKVDLHVFRIGWNGLYGVSDAQGGVGGLLAAG